MVKNILFYVNKPGDMKCENVLSISCISKIKIHLFISKQNVSLQVCCTLNYPNKFSKF